MLSVQSKICYKGFRLTEYSKRNKVYFVSSLGLLAESYVLVKNIISINCIRVSASLRISTFFMVCAVSGKKCASIFPQHSWTSCLDNRAPDVSAADLE